VRTIVVWKHPSGYPSLYIPDSTCCVRTIVVWKQLLEIGQTTNGVLRENHSGMETTENQPARKCRAKLRENHSGMETNFHIHISHSLIGLRENHSGMETSRLDILDQNVQYSRCVRTIVV